MKNDFQPVVGHRFDFRAVPVAQWTGVTDCEVLIVEPRAAADFKFYWRQRRGFKKSRGYV
jgi:hypothetical protein